MDNTLKRVCKLADSKDLELRCAAVRVIGELGEGGAAIFEAIRGALRTANEPLRLHALAAAERIDLLALLSDVLALLGDTGAVGRRAGEVVASLGVKALPALLPALEKADGSTRQAILGVLAGIPGARAEQALIRALAEADDAAAEGVARALSVRLGTLTGQARRDLGDAVADLLKTRKRLAGEAVAAGLRVLGRVGDPKYRPLLLELSRPDQPPVTRREALLALSVMPAPPKGGDRLLQLFLKYLDEPDFGNVVQPALAAIQRIPTPPSLGNELERLLEQGSPAVRRVAAEKLGEVDRAARGKPLLRYFDDPDSGIQEAVSGALGKMTSAVPALLAALEKAEDAERAWRIVRILEKHGKLIQAGAARRLLQVGTARVEKDHPAARPTLYLLRKVSPRSFIQSLLQRARKLLGQKKAHAADALLALLAREDLDSAQARYDYAVVKLAVSRLDVSLGYRESDPALRELTALLREGAGKLARRLVTERALLPSHLLYAGFHFAERSGDEKAYGADVLRSVVRRFPRAPEAQVAKNKLVSEAIDRPKEAARAPTHSAAKSRR